MSLTEIIKVNGDILTKRAPWLDGRACLGALAEVESNFGKFKGAKYEQSFGYHGVYKNNDLLTKYGDAAACSWGTWQIMYPTACELGFRAHPWDLMDDSISIPWVLEYIQKRILDKGCSSPGQIADAYNTGSFKDKIKNLGYTSSFLRNYSTVKDTRGLW